MSLPLTADSSGSRHPFRDGFGDRSPAAGRDGERLEMLRVRPELGGTPGFEDAVRTRAAALAGFVDPSFAAVRHVERVPPGPLTVVADRPEGVRLSFLLDRARGGELDTTPRVAIAALRQLVPALARFHAYGVGLTHGALAPERVIVTPGGRLVITDAVFGAALERLGLPRRQLWQTFRVAAPPAAGTVRLDERADLIQIGLVALALLAGRSIEADEFPERLPMLARGTIGEWTARGRPVPPAIAAWLLHALQLDPRRSHATMADALAALGDTPAWQIDDLSAGRAMAAWAGGETVARVARREQVIRLATSGPAPQASSSGSVTARDLVQAVGDISRPAPAPIGPVAVPDPIRPMARRTVPSARSVRPPVERVEAPRVAPPFEPAGVSRPAPPPAEPRVPPPATGPPSPPPAIETLRSAPVSDGRSRLRFPALAVAALVGAAGVFLAQRIMAPEPGTLALETTPRGVEVAVDGESRGETPLELRLAAGPHMIELRGPGAPRLLEVEIAPGERSARQVDFTQPRRVPAEPPTGWLMVSAPFDVVLRSQGQPLTAAEDGRITLESGRHAMEITNEELGFREVRVAEIRGGRVTQLTVKAPTGTVHLNAKPWAEVWLDGTRIGETPLGNLAVPIGRHEFVFRNPELGEKRYDVSVTLLEPIHLTVDMSP